MTETKSPSLPGRAGFTLIETLIVLALMLVVATLAAPSLKCTLVRSKLAGYSQQALLMVQQARWEAIKQGADAVVEIAGNEIVSRASNPERVLGRLPLPRGVSFVTAAGTATCSSSGACTLADGELRFKDDYGNEMAVVLRSRATGRFELVKKGEDGVDRANGDDDEAWRFKC